MNSPLESIGQQESQSATRRYDIDALRVIAFGLLIIYHVAMYFVADWHFHLKAENTFEWLKFPMMLVNQWRMHLLFLVSGLACAFVFKGSSLDFLKSRFARILPPFIVGFILIVPVQPYLQAIDNGSISMSYLEFLIRYFQFSQWPVGAFDGSEYRFTWNHLWFIPYLLAYIAVLPILRSTYRKLKPKAYFLLALTAPLLGILYFLTFNGVPEGALFGTSGWLWPYAAVYVLSLPLSFTTCRRLGRTTITTLLISPMCYFLCARFLLEPYFPASHALYNDGYLHSLYLFCFVFGFAMLKHNEIWAFLEKYRFALLLTALLCYCAIVALYWIFNQHYWQEVLRNSIIAINMWLWILALLGLSKRYLNKPMAWVKWANARIYTWYIVHQSAIIVAAYALAKIGWDNLPILTLITIAACWLCTVILKGNAKMAKLFGFYHTDKPSLATEQKDQKSRILET